VNMSDPPCRIHLHELTVFGRLDDRDYRHGHFENILSLMLITASIVVQQKLRESNASRADGQPNSFRFLLID